MSIEVYPKSQKSDLPSSLNKASTSEFFDDISKNCKSLSNNDNIQLVSSSKKNKNKVRFKEPLVESQNGEILIENNENNLKQGNTNNFNDNDDDDYYYYLTKGSDKLDVQEKLNLSSSSTLLTNFNRANSSNEIYTSNLTRKDKENITIQDRNFEISLAHNKKQGILKETITNSNNQKSKENMINPSKKKPKKVWEEEIPSNSKYFAKKDNNLVTPHANSKKTFTETKSNPLNSVPQSMESSLKSPLRTKSPTNTESIFQEEITTNVPSSRKKVRFASPQYQRRQEKLDGQVIEENIQEKINYDEIPNNSKYMEKFWSQKKTVSHSNQEKISKIQKGSSSCKSLKVEEKMSNVHCETRENFHNSKENDSHTKNGKNLNIKSEEKIGKVSKTVTFNLSQDDNVGNYSIKNMENTEDIAKSNENHHQVCESKDRETKNFLVPKEKPTQIIQLKLKNSVEKSNNSAKAGTKSLNNSPRPKSESNQRNFESIEKSKGSRPQITDDKLFDDKFIEGLLEGLDNFERRNLLWEINKRKKLIKNEGKKLEEEKFNCTFEPTFYTKKERHNMKPDDFYKMHIEYKQEAQNLATQKYSEQMKKPKMVNKINSKEKLLKIEPLYFEKKALSQVNEKSSTNIPIDTHKFKKKNGINLQEFLKTAQISHYVELPQNEVNNVEGFTSQSSKSTMSRD